ncbi:MAG: bifunctional 2-C-methyl-D-erythritol 4-phosphate cytidylyltransferase IspD/2-C-methyl-D-erythritol 2,4-cyclodiphosphate synthase IspF [Candidatus Peregrinibacteria bacterium]|nr:bifunctional 2-C-methyl-D-erythritol 4-phosphate cytidylyltransferase IspD/2-C-methyl-D-erythritol 2,4-cyclodiphosphate synthase IspF [Candidatus Peregrinibacteria bacterium]MDZ4244403.1 bifunctional 2-C-methyl-D-erythritol 4-phosphate cytidylyltransferase IspD/2-C-methyl-D-erythritol 2,4-cyclodiphosphate synthase IspF [Candidatus Gracilibacteria bacterium]
MNVFALILGGGVSERFGSDKLACKLGNESVIERTHRIFHESEIFGDVFTVTISGNSMPFAKFVKPGGSRFESMQAGVKEILKNVEEEEYGDTFVMIHNAANPGVTVEEIQACLDGAIKVGACGVAHKVKDTIRRKSLGSETFEVLNREDLYAMQTPQCIRLDILLKGIELFQEIQAKNRRPSGTLFGKQAGALAMTDDLQLLDLINRNPEEKAAYTLIEASKTNFKITTEEDLGKMRAGIGLGNACAREQRVGVGQDSHEFAEDGILTLGGLQFSDFPKLSANSDGDIILHALFNAISSALGESSLGQTADKMCENGIKDSREYLKVILEKMQSAGYSIGNLSIALICKKPKIDAIENDLKKSIIEILKPYYKKNPNITIGLTATSGEGIDLFGKGIQCTCFVNLI